jgi:hypothetical protein
MKICKKCNFKKELSSFRKIKGMKDGHSNSCKECDVISNREYKEKNKEKVSEKKRLWCETNKEKIKEQKKEYRKNNKEHLKENDKIWREENKEHLKEYYTNNKEYLNEKSKIWREENKDAIKEQKKEYYNNNKESISSKIKIWQEENKDIIRKQKKEYYKENREVILQKGKNRYEINKDEINIRIKNRLKNDSLFKLKFNIRSLIRNSFRYKGIKKNSKTQEILGCSFEDFKLHLESKFEDWMTWENRALYNGELNYGWDIDHIIPLITAETEEDIIRLNNYTNLQPLCSYTNRHIKKDRLDF